MTKHRNKLPAPDPSNLAGLSFGNLHELAEILEALGLHLHSSNRVALGDSGYYWHLAETLRKLGRLAALPMEMPTVDEKFGCAYTPGTLAHREQVRHFLSLLQAQSK